MSPLKTMSSFAALLLLAPLALVAIEHTSEENLCSRAADNDPTFLNCSSNAAKSAALPTPEPPKYLQSVLLGNPSVALTRITSNEAFQVKNGNARHSYSRRQPWNSDETLIDVGNKLIDGDSYQFVVDSVPMTSERVWSNLDPNTMFGFSFYNDVRNRFVRFQTDSGELTDVVILLEYTNCTIGKGEGTLSNDDKKVLFICQDKNNNDTLISYSLDTHRVLGTHQIAGEINWAGFSQSGKYIVVEVKRPGDKVKVLLRYSPTLTGEFLLTKRRHHGDFGVDQNGDDVFAMIGQFKASYIRLYDGQRIWLPISGPLNQLENGHMSCRNILRPGWCYLSANSGFIGAVRISDKGLKGFTALGIRKVTENTGFEHWGYHYSTRSSYAAQPKLVPSPSGRSVMFTTDWNGLGEINSYIAEPVQP